jgi:hypothetical protein
VKALRLILVEDSDDDALLLLRALRAGGFEVDHRRVWDRGSCRQRWETAPGTW